MKKSRIAIILTLSAVLLAGCASGSKNETPAAGSPTGGTETPVVEVAEPFKVILNAQPTGFNPLTTNDSMSSDINIQIYETLYVRTPDGTSYEPLLAESMPVRS